MNTEPTYKIRGDKAFCTGAWSERLGNELISEKVRSMELVGDWFDLSCFQGQTDLIEALKISGSLKNGAIRAIGNIGIFTNLKVLTMASKVKEGYNLSLLPELEHVDIVWQEDSESVLRNINLRSATFESLDLDVGSIGGTNAIGVKRLWLSKPKVKDLEFLRLFPNLRDLTISNSRSVATLSGISKCQRIEEIDLEKIPKLVDIDEIGELKKLKKLRLMQVPSGLNLSVLGNCSALSDICVAGPKTPWLPWELVLSNPLLNSVTGWWNSDEGDYDVLRTYLPSSRKIVDISQIGTKKRPLLTLAIE